MEHEILGSGPLLDSSGRLREAGWARHPLLSYDRSAVRVPAFRIKEWDYYCILAGDSGIALTVADNGYMGLLSATVFDFARPAEVTDSLMTAFPMGRTGLPVRSESGVTEIRRKGVRVRFESGGGRRTLSFSWPDFGKKRAGTGGTACGLSGEIHLTEQEGGESMVIATPFFRAPRSFYYNQKINCQDAQGSFRFGGKECRLEKGKAFGVLDWGRGVWTYANTWYWGSASGLARLREDGVTGKTKDARPRKTGPFGFNIGHGFGDTRAASENMVFFEGRAHKIGELEISLDPKDFMKPWRAVSADGRFDMKLSPILDRAATTKLGILVSIQHQVFGDWSGRAVLDDGREIRVEKLRGFCEKVVNRW